MPMQVSWIEESDMTALLGRLREPASPAKDDEEEFGGAGTLFEEPAAAPPEPAPAHMAAAAPAEPHADLDDFRSRLQAIRERAVGAGLLPQPVVVQEEVEEPAEAGFEEPAARSHPQEEEEAPATAAQETTAWTAFEPRGSSVMERLESFASWAEPNLQESELFVIDDQGDILRGSPDHQELVLTTVMAWVASSRMSAVFAFDRAPLLRQAMASGGHLVAIPCPTRLGLLHIAITSAQPLPDEHLPELRHALISAMEAVE